MFLQLPDRGQHFLMRGHHRRPETGILQRLRAADGVAERGGGLIQAVHAKVLGHALQRVAGAEGQLTNFLMSASLGSRLMVAL
mgnify:CR=1 FL=1